MAARPHAASHAAGVAARSDAASHATGVAARPHAASHAAGVPARSDAAGHAAGVPARPHAAGMPRAARQRGRMHVARVVHALGTMLHPVVIAAQAMPAGMEMLQMPAIAVRRAVPAMPVVVVAPADVIASKHQKFRLPLDQSRRHAADIGDAVNPLVAGHEHAARRGLRNHRRRRHHHLRRRMQPVAALVEQCFALLQPVGIRRVPAHQRGAVHQRHLRDIRAVVQHADVGSRQRLRIAGQGVAVRRDIALQLTHIRRAEALQAVEHIGLPLGHQGRGVLHQRVFQHHRRRRQIGPQPAPRRLRRGFLLAIRHRRVVAGAGRAVDQRRLGHVGAVRQQADEIGRGLRLAGHPVAARGQKTLQTLRRLPRQADHAEQRHALLAAGQPGGVDHLRMIDADRHRRHRRRGRGGGNALTRRSARRRWAEGGRGDLAGVRQLQRRRSRLGGGRRPGGRARRCEGGRRRRRLRRRLRQHRVRRQPALHLVARRRRRDRRGGGGLRLVHAAGLRQGRTGHQHTERTQHASQQKHAVLRQRAARRRHGGVSSATEAPSACGQRWG